MRFRTRGINYYQNRPGRGRSMRGHRNCRQTNRRRSWPRSYSTRQLRRNVSFSPLLTKNQELGTNVCIGSYEANTKLDFSSHTTMIRVILAYPVGWIESGPLIVFQGLFSRWRSVSQESKKLILQPLSVLRPKFRVSAVFNR
jgi:hypothetical protein